MPCIKCNNGKWKYGQHGRCQFDTLAACRAAEAAIHIEENKPKKKKSEGCDCENCSEKHSCSRSKVKSE